MKTERSILAPATRSRVWRALTDMDEFRQWFGVEFVGGRFAGGRFAAGQRVDMTCTAPEYAGMAFYLVVEEVTPESRFVWRWHPGLQKPGEDFSAEPMTQVVFELEEVDGGTRVRVVETGFEQLPPDRGERAQKENDGGWVYMLESLVRHL